MYRAKIQAIRNGKVYADGKWLKCIGNKFFHVGENVWTDGRCVYGNNNTPQRPFIPPPVEEIAIPILLREGYGVFNFTNGYAYNFTDEGLQATAEIELPYKSHFAWLINDDKNVLLFQSAQHLAVNIKDGNLYSLENDGLTTGEEPFIVKVKKNNEILKEVSFKSEFKETISACSAEGDEDDGDIDLYWGFIEDADNWAFIVRLMAVVEPSVSSQRREEYALERWYYFSSNKQPVILVVEAEHREYASAYDPPSDTPYLNVSHSVDLVGSEKIPIQDGYYYTTDESIPFEHFTGFSTRTHYLHRQTIFSPNNQKIFTGLFSPYPYLTLCQVKSGYLLGVRNNYRELEEQEEFGEYCCDGIHLITNNGKQTLATCKCLNQRLRPMNDIEYWVQRIQMINPE